MQAELVIGWSEFEDIPYNPNQDALHQLPQHQQTIIFHIRTGHCRLNSHLKRIGIKTYVQCLWGEAGPKPKLYLQSCSLYHQARQQIWPTCVSLKTKLWGPAEGFVPDIQVCSIGKKNEDMPYMQVCYKSVGLWISLCSCSQRVTATII